MTANNDYEYATVMLLTDAKTDSGTEVKEGAEAVIVDKFGDDFILEFALEAPELEGGKRFETAVLGAECFAITSVFEKQLHNLS